MSTLTVHQQCKVYVVGSKLLGQQRVSVRLLTEFRYEREHGEIADYIKQSLREAHVAMTRCC
jgi:hypothetical protein